MNYLFRLFLTASALSLFATIFLINRKMVPNNFLHDYIWYLTYVSFPFAFTFITIQLSKMLGSANFGDVMFVEPANNDFLSNYLAFFFVALSLDDLVTFSFCLGLTLIFTFYSRVAYFNPILLVFGYNFYYVTSSNKSKVMLITKRTIKSPSDIGSEKNCKRINDFTFIG